MSEPTDLSPDEMTELVIMYVTLNTQGWPLTERQEEDFTEFCQILLIAALMRGGLSVETALHQVTERDGKLSVRVNNGELSISVEYDEHAENAVSVMIIEGLA